MEFCIVGMPGIEPGLQTPHARVLPLYYTPFELILISILNIEAVLFKKINNKRS